MLVNRVLLLVVTCALFALAAGVAESGAQEDCIDTPPEDWSDLKEVLRCVQRKADAAQSALKGLKQREDDFLSATKNAVLAINARQCPEGWRQFQDGAGRFLLGAVANGGDLGEEGGSSQHSHSVSGTVSGGPWKGSDSNWGSTPWANGPNPARGGDGLSGSTNAPAVWPPFVKVLFCERD